ncbi:MAG: helix-turn-helix transcriptional regulator, partial [Arachnia sp.]
GFDAAWEAITERRELRFEYKGQPRRLLPWRLLQRRGRWYLLGQDLDRGQPRRFKLARFTGTPTAVGKSEAFQVPPTEQIAELLDVSAADPVATALVAVPQGTSPGLIRGAKPAGEVTGVPEGFTAYLVSGHGTQNLVAQVCELGPSAKVIDPPELRQRVIDQLREVQQLWSR